MKAGNQIERRHHMAKDPFLATLIKITKKGLNFKEASGFSSCNTIRTLNSLIQRVRHADKTINIFADILFFLLFVFSETMLG